MYNNIKSGTKVTVQSLDCWIPPVGMGTHCVTGELSPVDIIKRSASPAEQYWERQQIAEDFEDLVALEEEEAERRNDPNYSDPDLDAIRDREWNRREYGVWFYNNGKPVYLTGLNYFFLNYWELDTGYPDYRLIDLEYFYFWQYCVEDPFCYGLIEICKRRNGKTYRGGCVLYEAASRVEKAHCGMQQKKLDDARDDIYMKAVLPQFMRLPSFFRPVYDMALGDAPKGGLRFFKTSQKGKKSIKSFRDRNRKELRSQIDYRDSKIKAYDGTKLYRGLFDESAKLEVDIIERHGVLKKCLENNKREIVGKMIVTSTVEEIGIKFRFQDLWNWSNQTEREVTGKTKSGLYKFFQPADRSGDYDIYGTPKQKETLSAILAERESLQEEMDDLVAFIRKEPLTADESFSVANKQCHFNLAKLNNHRSNISVLDRITERGNLHWKDGKKFTSSIWEKDKGGRLEIPIGFRFSEGECNNVINIGGRYRPGNKVRYVMGLDPYDHNDPEDGGRKSLAAALVLKKNDPMNPNDPYNKAFVLKYHNRQRTATLMFEDIIKICWHFGCQVLYESQKPGVGNYFKEHNCEDFLVKIPGYKDFGIPSTTENKESLLYATEEYIENHIEKVYFLSLIDDWIKFDVTKTQKFDLSMAAGWTLIADLHKVLKTEGKLKPITQYIRKHKIIA